MKKINKVVVWIMILFLLTNIMLLTACGTTGDSGNPGGSGGSGSSGGSGGSGGSGNPGGSGDFVGNFELSDPPLFASAISSFDDGYKSDANWIWTDTPVKQGQWVAMRKTFNLDRAPISAIARISADTKYWMWINGELAIFEGQLKLGNSIDTWFYDKEDIAKYLVEGENTIAVQVFYSGKNSSSTINTGVPGFLFDAEIDGKRLYSDTTWRATLDPAYEEPISLNNGRIGEANIKYNAMYEMVDENGIKWTDVGFNDDYWYDAVNVDQRILTNRIYEDWGAVSNVYYKDLDPRRNLVLRSIPQMKLEEVTTYTADSWTTTSGNSTFVPLSLPDAYTLEAEVVVAEPLEYVSGQPIGASIGFCVCVSDSSNFYMPQISFRQANRFDGVAFKPHVKRNGSWNVSTQDLTSASIGQSLLGSSYDYRYNTKHTVKIVVTPQTISTYLNGTLLGVMNDTTLQRAGSTIGIRQDINELVKIYSFKVTDTSGNELYNANIGDLKQNDSLKTMSLLSAEVAAHGSVYNTVDISGQDSYISVRNACAAINNGQTGTKYIIVNKTNIQGTPYLKVRSKTGGELISIKSDTWVNGNATSLAPQYITTVGEQTWEPLGWINGYKITFTIPDSVEVLELGFRQSGYNTETTGSVTTNNDTINQLYQEAYDTLYVCMRDSFMDCPDRERAQWLGDAVINMQQAAYAMDENAALLYKKTLTQAIGFVKKGGEIPTMIALGNSNLELPMQTLAGVHSFWQYYMYYGDAQLLIDSYPVLLNYLKLWDISESGVITHRGGTWDWIDWGEHYDTTVIENCWYYIALKTVLNIANLEGSGATAGDIQFLEGRMELIAKNFDTVYWNASRNAYYYNTDNGVADDRANAMAIYSGLADDSRYDGILNVLLNTYNASPYMEKYVLESMYMMGADDEAILRTLNRFRPFTEDGYPTLPEIWSDQSLFGGDETKNHAWTGAPLSLLYMCNAGITPTGPAFKTVQIKPQLGALTNVSATVQRAGGTIIVNVTKSSGGYTLNVTLSNGSEGGVICVPRIDGVDTMVTLNGVTLYANGAPVNANMPTGVSYAWEDADFVAFNVPAGEYKFAAQKNEAGASSSYQTVIHATEGGSVKVNGVIVGAYPYTQSTAKGQNVTLEIIPEDGYRVVEITGSFPERVVSEISVTKTYQVLSNMTVNVVFEKIRYTNKSLTITTSNEDVAKYALSIYVNENEVSLPYTGAFEKGTQITVEAKSPDANNYTITIDGVAITKKTVTLSDSMSLVIGITENSTVNKIDISGVTASNTLTVSPEWSTANLIDGIRTSIPGISLGYTSGHTFTGDVSSNPYVLTFNLGSAQTINQVSLFPRTDSWAADSTLSCCYPVDFTIAVSTDGVNYTTVATITNEANPKFKQQCYSFTNAQAQYVKITVTKVGLPPYNDGTNNDHYRLQLAEVEVYYNSKLS